MSSCIDTWRHLSLFIVQDVQTEIMLIRSNQYNAWTLIERDTLPADFVRVTF